MAILLECSPGEAGWEEVTVGKWLGRKEDLVIKLRNWSAKEMFKRFDIRVRLRSGDARLYDYFPFSFKLSGKAPQAEIGEIDGADQSSEVILEHVAPDWDGQLTLSFASELSGIPKRAGISADERNLALLLDKIAIQHSTVTPSSATVPTGFDLDLDNLQTGAPIFVVGSGRCGSSVLTWALGQHPNIASLDETNWLPMTLYGAAAAFQMASNASLNFPTKYDIDLDRFIQYIGGAFERMHIDAFRSRAQRDFLQRLSRPEIGFNPDFQQVRTNWSPKRRWVDGAPVNTSAIPLLARAFSEAKFIGIIRDPRDVIASYCNFNTVGGITVSLDEAAIMWLRAASMLLWARENLGASRAMIVYFDEFEQPDQLIRALLSFLSEANCAACLKPFGTRINSSNVSESDRKAIKGPSVDKCDAIYAKIRAGQTWSMIDWGDKTVTDIDGWLQDVINRLIKVIS